MTCDCGNPAHSGFVTAAELHRRHEQRQVAREWWSRLRAAVQPGQEELALTHDGIGALGCGLRSDPDGVLRDVIQDGMRDEMRAAAEIRRLEWLIRDGRRNGPPRQLRNAQRELAALGEDASARANAAESWAAAVDAGIELARQTIAADEMLTLSRTAPDNESLRPIPRVQVPTLADERTRARLHLMGHEHSRKLSLGTQRERLGVHGAVRHQLPASDGHGSNHPPVEADTPDDQLTPEQRAAAETGAPAPNQQEVAPPGRGSARARRGTRAAGRRRGRKR